MCEQALEKEKAAAKAMRHEVWLQSCQGLRGERVAAAEAVAAQEAAIAGARSQQQYDRATAAMAVAKLRAQDAAAAQVTPAGPTPIMFLQLLYIQSYPLYHVFLCIRAVDELFLAINTCS